MNTMKVHLLKTALFYQRRVFRTLAIQGTQTLSDLHHGIRHAFHRGKDSIYAFYFPPHPTKSLRIIRSSPCIISMMLPQSRSLPYSILDAVLEKKLSEEKSPESVTVDQLELKPDQTFYYLFDFVEQWWHEIVYLGDREIPFCKTPAVVEKAGKSPGKPVEM